MASLVKTFLSQLPGRFERSPENELGSASMSGELARIPENYDVYIETEPGRDEYQLAPKEIDWSNIELGLDEVGSRATLIVRALDSSKLTSGGKLGSTHLKHLLEALNPNSRILIAAGRGAGQLKILFSGYPLIGSASWSPAHQGLTWTVISNGVDLLRTRKEAQIVGRIMRKYPFLDPGQFTDPDNYDLIEVDVLPPIFNADGKPNMLDQNLLLPNTDGMRVFCGDSDQGAVHWHFANALRYVAAFYASFAGIDAGPLMRDTNAMVSLPAGGTSQDPFTHRMLQQVEGVSIASMSAFEAMVALCQKGGLRFEVARRLGTVGNAEPFYLRVIAPIGGPIDDRGTRSRLMIAPQSRDIPRDPPFTNYAGFSPADIALRNAAQMAQLTADNRVVNAPVIVGGASDYEVTLLLRPGWKPFPYLDLDFTGMTPGERDAAVSAAITFWEDEFGEEDESRGANAIPNSKFHTQHPDHHEVADIGRLWIFPDTTAYMKTAALISSDYRRKLGPWTTPEHYSPFGLDANNRLQVYTDFALGGGLPASIVEKWVLRRRPFGNMLSRASLQVADPAPRVELNFTDDLIQNATAYGNRNWIPFTGSVVIDKDRAALWIKDDNLLLSPKLQFTNEAGDEFHYLKALIGVDLSGTYTGPHLFVRITCTVRGDQRLVSRPPKSNNALLRERSSVIDLGYEQFKETNRIEGNSVFVDIPESDPSYQDRDDREALDLFAKDQQKLLDRITVGGDFETSYIETGVRLGDVFRGSTGLGIQFATWPTVTTIEWIKDSDAGYRTKFHLDDLRHAPDVGTEA